MEESKGRQGFRVLGVCSAFIYLITIIGLTKSWIECAQIDASLYGIALVSFIVALACKKPFLPMLGSWIAGIYLAWTGMMGKRIMWGVASETYSRKAEEIAFDFSLMAAVGFVFCMFGLIAAIVWFVQRRTRNISR